MSRFVKIVLTLAVLMGIGQTFHSQVASAVTAADWRAGSIIDDGLFYRASDLSPTDIQNFLNSKVPNCDTWGTQPYAGTTRAAYGASRGSSPPYTCLKDYAMDTQGKAADSYCSGIGASRRSAASIIYDVSNACGISAKALIVMLEKEQGLVSDDWPWGIQYRSAMGYGCPDTAPCDAEYYGFFNQVYNAARQFKVYTANPGSYRYKPYQTNFIYWHPSLGGCGGTNVYVDNRATAGLYNYTPYQPNQAALNNLYGTGDSCSAYGNRNFWRMHNDWFESTQGRLYSWSIESYDYSGGDNLIAIGQNEIVTLRVRNTGRVPWYNHGDHPMKLGTWEPADRYSNLFRSNRLATMQENSVQPGGIATFVFQISPQTPGTYVEGLNLVAENYSYLPWTGLRPTIQVTSPYQWKIENIVYENGTGVMIPGSTQLITVIAKNTGTTTWTKGGSTPVRLGTWEPQRQSSVMSNWISSTRAVEMNETSVSPGQNAGFQFYVRMPNTGPFYEKFNLVAENITWFNNPGLTLWLSGAPYSWSVQSVEYSNGTGVMRPDTTQTITVKALNNGQATWKKDGDFPIKLGTWPPNRQSEVALNWLSPTRMSGLIEQTVPPGQIGTFTAQVKVPAAGIYYQRMNLVAEGLTWMNDASLTFYLEGKY